VIKEVEKLVPQIEYREVVKEVVKSPGKEAIMVSAHETKPRKMTLKSAAPQPAAPITAPASSSSTRTVGEYFFSTLIRQIVIGRP